MSRQAPASTASGGGAAGDGGTTSFGSLITCPGGKSAIGALISSYPDIVTRTQESLSPTGGNITNAIGRGSESVVVVAAGKLSNVLPVNSLFLTRAGEGSAASFSVQNQAAKAGTNGLAGGVYIQEYS